MKPGYKTTEFWLTALASILGLLFASGAIPTDSGLDRILGGLATALATVGYSVSRGIAKKGAQLLCIGLAGLALTGCTTAIKSDKIISIKQRTFGLAVGVNPVNQAPDIKLGFITTVYQMIPTSTNNTVYAPRYFDTLELEQGVNPFATDIRENTGSGDVAIGTNATGQAIIPKTIIPSSPARPLTK